MFDEDDGALERTDLLPGRGGETRYTVCCPKCMSTDVWKLGGGVFSIWLAWIFPAAVSAREDSLMCGCCGLVFRSSDSF